MAVSDQDRRLVREALEQAHGEGVAGTMMELLPPVGWGDVARQSDVESLRRDLHSEIAQVRTDLHGEIALLRGEMLEKFGVIEGRFGQIDGRFGQIEGRFKELEARMQTMLTKAVVANAVAMVGVMLAGRYL